MSGPTTQDRGAWLDSGAFLPAPLRDFHDQKDVFKSLAEWKQEGPFTVDWVSGHVFVIDYFLRFMALHGWTLQRSRAHVAFQDLPHTIADRRAREAAVLREWLKRDRPPKDTSIGAALAAVEGT